MTKWKCKLKFNADKNRYDFSIYAGGKWHFVYDFQPCDNLKKFFKGLNENEEYITWLMNTGKEA